LNSISIEGDTWWSRGRKRHEDTKITVLERLLSI